MSEVTNAMAHRRSRAKSTSSLPGAEQAERLLVKREFILRFWGVRGSYPAPGATTLRFGGNTTCLEIRANGHLIILDAGTGIISLGQELIRQYNHQAQQRGSATPEPITVSILFTHAHLDHVIGLPFFSPLHLASSLIYMFGPRFLQEDLSDVLSRTIAAPYFPTDLEELASKKVIRNVTETDQIYWSSQSQVPEVFSADRLTRDHKAGGVRVSIFRCYAHPKHGVFVYRIEYNGKSVVFATDVEGYMYNDQRLINFSHNADILIHDAQYRAEDYANSTLPKQGWGHSTPQMAALVAREARAKQLILFHHDPTYNDSTVEAQERDAQSVFPNSQAAYEGLEIQLL